MNALRALLADRRRSQRGSVLSGVLILTAFLAIISGALMTELSTNFLLSNALVNRVGTEATVNSAMELALNQLENTPLTNGCPGAIPATPLPGPLTLNGRTAAVSYVSCWPTVREKPNFASIASPAAFNVDGTHSVIPGTGQDLYVIGDSGGTIYSYQFGQSTAIWSRNMQGTITGPALAMQDAACQGGPPCPDTGGAGGVNADISYLVPITGGGGSGCTAKACVELLGQDVPKPPDVLCHMAATATVTSRPAAGVAFPQVAYFGDSGGTLYAYDATEFSCSNSGPATLMAIQTTPGKAAIIAGPIVFKNNNRDEVYIVTSNGSTSQLLDYPYSQTGFASSPSESLTLPYPNPVGIALEKTSVPARVAVTFAGGGVAIVQIDSNYDPRFVTKTALGTGIADAPSWCSCPGGQQIGVAGVNGTLYVLDTNLNTVASSAGGSPIRTTPASDQVGEWFFGADDGYLREVQQTPGQPTLVEVAKYGSLGTVSSSVQVAGCPAGICVYLGSSSNAYIVSLDARDAKLTACLSSTPPACSGANPRLWAQVEVGSAGGPQTVHVQGWSYYSP